MFGVLKVHWPTLYNIPVQIKRDRERGHKQVINWTTICVGLHNILNRLKDDQIWLDIQIEQQEENNNNAERECNTETKQVGTRRREDLRNLVALLSSAKISICIVCTECTQRSFAKLLIMTQYVTSVCTMRQTH